MQTLTSALPDELQQRIARYRAGERPPSISARPSSGKALPSATRTPAKLTTWQPGEPLTVSHEVAMMTVGENFTGCSIGDVHPTARPLLSAYLSRLTEMYSNGYGLAFTGVQGTGKTAAMALIAQAAVSYLPQPIICQFDTYQARQVVYVRMTRLLRMCSDFLPASARQEWVREYEQWKRARYLFIDEAHLVIDNDRSCSMLLDLIDTRVSEQRTTILAMNARWDNLREDPSRLLQQVREKLEAVTREIVIPGTSRRKPWTLGGG